MNSKIKTVGEIIDIAEKLKKEGRKTVLSLGIFDVIHPGIIAHLRLAKKQGDTLIVSVIKNKDVRRGPSRPIFDEGLRAENVASIEYVDYVCLVDDSPPFECLKVIKPDVFAKGEDYKDRPEEISAILKYEEDAIRIAGCKVHFTTGTTVSSTHIINQFLDIYPEETRKYLNGLSCKYNILQIVDMIEDTRGLNVLIIGDGIIDEYHYCESMGRSAKDHLVVSRYLSKEAFAGGAFAIANHTASVCEKVQLVTLLGKDDTREDFILNKLKPNITYKFFYRDDGPTIIKTRFVNQYLNQKIFEVCYMNNDNIEGHLEGEILEYLAPRLQEYDLVMVADFGHGFITDDIIRLIESKAKILGVMVQTNSANVGFNLVTKYRRADFVCIDELETRLASQDRYSKIENVIERLTKEIDAKYLIITRGSRGSLGFSKKNGLIQTPALATKVVDRIGAGDAFFAYTSCCFAKDIPEDVISFVGNAVGAIAVQIVCNREAVPLEKLYEFIDALLR